MPAAKCALVLAAALTVAAAPIALAQAPSRAAPAPATTPPAPLPPLGIETAAFAAAVATGGGYLPRESSVFQPTETVDIYVAVTGFGARPITTGVRVEFQVSVQIRNVGSNAVIARSGEFQNIGVDGKVAPATYYGDVQFTLPSLRAGSYVLTLTLRDVLDGRSGSAELPFSVMPRL